MVKQWGQVVIILNKEKFKNTYSFKTLCILNIQAIYRNKNIILLKIFFWVRKPNTNYLKNYIHHNVFELLIYL